MTGRPRRTLLAISTALLVACSSAGDGASDVPDVSNTAPTTDSAPTTPEEAAGRPPDARPVVDRVGVEIGWVGTVDGVVVDDGGDVADLVRAELPSADGAEIVTTIDAELQAHLVDALGTVPSTNGRFDVSAVVVDVVTGEVVAAADTSPTSSLASFSRPTGSVLKFLVALGAFDAGAQSDDQLDGGDRCVLPAPDAPDDPARAMSFAGDPAFAPADLRTLTAFSVNCAFAKLYTAVGGEGILRLAAELGLTEVVDDTPRLVIGAATASPLQLARAMAAVLGDGTFADPPVIAGSAGGDSARRVIVDPSTANATAQMLTAVVDVGTASGAGLAGERPGAGKTGTQANNTDAWFVGGTPQYAVAVWMGNAAAGADGMVGVPEFGDVVRVQGGAYPAQVWKAFLDAALADEPPADWPAAQSDRDPVRIVVPSIECSATPFVPGLGLPAIPLDAVVGDCP